MKISIALAALLSTIVAATPVAVPQNFTVCQEMCGLKPLTCNSGWVSLKTRQPLRINKSGIPSMKLNANAALGVNQNWRLLPVLQVRHKGITDFEIWGA